MQKSLPPVAHKTVQDQVAAIIAKYFDLPSIPDGATLGDLGADSLDLTEIILDVEDELDVEVNIDTTLTSNGLSLTTTAAAAAMLIASKITRQ